MQQALPTRCPGRCGGIGELIEPGGTGFLVPPNDPRALAEMIKRLWANANLRREMGQKALASVQQHDLQGQVARMLAIFRQVVDQQKAERAFDLDVLLYHAGHSWSPPSRAFCTSSPP